jgi:hypothetical protein
LTSVPLMKPRVGEWSTNAQMLSSKRGAIARDWMELSKAGYYADFILYPLLIVGLGAREMNFAHTFPYVWLSTTAVSMSLASSLPS